MDALDASLTKIHQWQAARPSGPDLAARLEEILDTYGLTTQLVEIWRKQRVEIQTMHQEITRLIERIAELEKALRQKVVGDEGRG